MVESNPLIIGLRKLAALDRDQEKNEAGVSKEDLELMHLLANKSELTYADQKEAKRILKKYRKQLGADLYDQINNFEIKKPSAEKGTDKSHLITSFYEASDGSFLEEIRPPSSLEATTDAVGQFVHYFPDTDKYEIISEFKDGELLVSPIPLTKEILKTLTLADGVEEYGTTSQLIKEMEEIGKLYDPVNEGPIWKVWIRIALTSHIVNEIFEGHAEKYASILRITGTSESGKGRALTVMRYLMRRPMYFLKTTRVPSLFRAISPWNATLLLDEADVTSSGDSDEFIEYLNARATGSIIPRYYSETDTVRFMGSFGNTVLATRKTYDDDGANSRTIPLKAEQTSNDIDLIPPDTWVKKGEEIQRKLLLWRLRHLAKIRKGEIKLPTKLTMKDVQSFRVKEAYLVLSALKDEDQDVYEDVVKIAKEIDRRLIEERAQSPTGLILSAVYGILSDEGSVERKGDYLQIIHEKDVVNEGGEKETTTVPLTLKEVSESLGRVFSPSEIAKYWRASGQGVKDQDRVEGKRYRGILKITDPKRLDHEFLRYVIGSSEKLREYYEKINSKQGHLSDGTSSTSGTDGNEAVPDVPHVPEEIYINEKNNFKGRCPHGQVWDSLERECILIESNEKES